MSLWIKICGLTTPAGVEAALQAGVDGIGFVFAQSPRQVSPTVAARLAQAARGRVSLIAVTKHPTQRCVDEILAAFRPDTLQTDVADISALSLPDQLELLPVYRSAPLEAPLPNETGRAPESLPARLLLEGPRSGAGLLADWAKAGRLAARVQLVLAGGLDPGNVAAAIDQVCPYGVDVSTGVESRPGIKSPEMIAQFVAAARAAAAAAAGRHANSKETI